MNIRRHIMGLCGIAFLSGGLTLLYWKGAHDSQWSMYASLGIRVGLMLGAIWLAFDQVVAVASRVPPWLVALVGFAGMVVAVRPRSIIYLAPVLGAIAVLQFVGWLFKPLPNPRRRQRKN